MNAPVTKKANQEALNEKARNELDLKKSPKRPSRKSKEKAKGGKKNDPESTLISTSPNSEDKFKIFIEQIENGNITTSTELERQWKSLSDDAEQDGQQLESEQWSDLLRACVTAQNECTLNLASTFLSDSKALPEDVQNKLQDALGLELLAKCTQLPKKYGSLTETKQTELATAAGRMTGLLTEYIGIDKVPFLDYWTDVFKKPTTYNIALVDHIKLDNTYDLLWASDEEGSTKITWFGMLEAFLENSKAIIVSLDESILQPLSAVICRTIEHCCVHLEDDPTNFGPAMRRVLNECLTGLRGDTTQTELNLYGQIFLGVINLFTYFTNNKKKWALVGVATEKIIHSCVNVWESSMKLDRSTWSAFIKDVRFFVFGFIAVYCPKLLHPELDYIFNVYKNYSSAVALLCLKHVHMWPPLPKNVLEAEFDFIFEKLSNQSYFEKHYIAYDTLLFIANQEPTPFKSTHVDSLEKLLPINSTDCLNIVRVLAEKNTALFKGRGQNYYDLSANCTTVTEILGFIGCTDESEAERVVALMEKRVAKDQQTENKNQVLQAWIKIAAIHPKPLAKRKKLIKEWQKESALTQSCTQLLQLVDGTPDSSSTVCTIL